MVDSTLSDSWTRRLGDLWTAKRGLPPGTRFWSGRRLQALNHGVWFLGLLVFVVAAVAAVTGSIGVDAHAYYTAWHHHLYTRAPEQRDAYLYSPLFAQIIWPLTLLPWPVFCALWLGTVTAIYWWLLAPLDLKWRIPLLLACTTDIVAGNVWSFFALVFVFGLTFSAAWIVPLVTKVTPVVGIVWFVARREWWKLLVLASVVLVLVGISVALSSSLWADWLRFLEHPPAAGSGRPVFFPSTPVLLAVELPLAIGVTIYAALTGRPWLVPVAMLFANPVFTANAFVVLAAIPRLRLALPTRPPGPVPVPG